MASIVLGKGFMERLYELGIIPMFTQRVVIDASINDVVKIYIEQYGDDRLLDVEVADFLGAQIIMEGEANGDSE